MQTAARLTIRPEERSQIEEDRDEQEHDREMRRAAVEAEPEAVIEVHWPNES